MEPKKFDALVARWQAPPRRVIAAPTPVQRQQQGQAFMEFMSAVNAQGR